MFYIFEVLANFMLVHIPRYLIDVSCRVRYCNDMVELTVISVCDTEPTSPDAVIHQTVDQVACDQ